MAGFIFYRVAAAAGMLKKSELVRVGTILNTQAWTHTHAHAHISHTYIYIYIYI